MAKSIIIIGAGIAGLSAGCYCQMNGYNTRIFELDNARAGGLCTSWKRRGFIINGCIHFLLGSKPENEFYKIWEELGAVQQRPMIDPDEYIRVEDGEGKAFILYPDINRLEQHMKELAPEDAKVIEEFTNGVRACIPFHMPIEKAPELYGPIDYFKLMFKMLPALKVMRKWQKISVPAFAKRFKNRLLREAFVEIIRSEALDIPMIGGLQQFAWFHNKVAAYPEGGSLPFAQAIERRYHDLGGEIQFKSRVSKILVENGKAVGIQLTDGIEHRGDVVISAADGHTTVFDMLGGKYINDKIRGYYNQLPVWPPLIHIALGVSRSFDELPHSVEGISFPLDAPVTIDGQKFKRLTVQIYNFDSTLAPAGKTVVRVEFFSDFERWRKLKQEPERYKLAKEQIADEVIAILDKRFPGLASQVEMCDVATPMTYHRNTRNWQSSYQGWLITTKTMGMRMSKNLPGLENFYMAGQWVEVGGGLPAVAISGRNVAQIICKKDKRQFVATTP